MNFPSVKQCGCLTLCNCSIINEMTNNENKIDKEKAIELIAGRIDDEFKKHPQLNWQKIAASKIHSQWFEQSQSALEEKDIEKHRKDFIGHYQHLKDNPEHIFNWFKPLITINYI